MADKVGEEAKVLMNANAQTVCDPLTEFIENKGVCLNTLTELVSFTAH